MNKKARQTWQRYLIPKIVCIAIVSAVLVALLTMHYRTNELKESVLDSIKTQEKVLLTLATTTMNNDADEVTRSIVADCSTEDRGMFDLLLERLSIAMKQDEVDKLDRLMDRCGDYFSMKKTLVATRLLREVIAYESYVKQLETITGGQHKDDYKIESWQRLGKAEVKQGEVLLELAGLQKEIIATLLKKEKDQSTRLEQILVRVEAAKKQQIIANEEAIAARKDLGIQ